MALLAAGTGHTPTVTATERRLFCVLVPYSSESALIQFVCVGGDSGLLPAPRAHSQGTVQAGCAVFRQPSELLWAWHFHVAHLTFFNKNFNREENSL